MALEQTIETISGDLRAYKSLVPGTFRHVDELNRERRDDKKLRDLWFYTADGEVYSVDNGTPTLRITREATNPVLRNIDDAFEQLTTTGDYFVSPEDFSAVKTAHDTVTIDLTKLELSGTDDEWRYLAVDTSKDLAGYNAEQQKLLLRVFGPTETDYDANMAKFRTSSQRIAETKIYVLAPDYVEAHAKKDPIGRASWLNDFDYDSLFDASGRYVNNGDRLRGVRREASVSEPVVPAGHADVQEVVALPQAYRAILAAPEAALSALDDKTAAGLLGIVFQYFAKKAQ